MWKKYNGVLCGRKIPVKLKGKIYRTVVLLRSAIIDACIGQRYCQQRKAKKSRMR